MSLRQTAAEDFIRSAAKHFSDPATTRCKDCTAKLLLYEARAREETDMDPSITVSQLRELAKQADIIGAKRYAEAYRIVANRLEKLADAADSDSGEGK